MSLFCPKCGTLLSSKGQNCPKCTVDTKVAKGGFTNSGAIFPFKKIRKGQETFMEDGEEVFREGRILVAHAPTGIGKTAAVLSAALKVRDGRKVFFLTSKQSQHHIAIETVKHMPSHVRAIDVISKQHMCPKEESSLPYPVFEKFCSDTGQSRCNLFNKNMEKVVNMLDETMHVEQIVRICRKHRVCPHKTALLAAQEADVLVCDYNYMFSDVSERILGLLEVELKDCMLIVDEAHNLPDRVRSHMEEYVNLELLRESYRLLEDQDKELAAFVKRFAREYNDVNSKDKSVSKDFLDDMIDIALRGGFSRYESLTELLPELEIAARDILEKDTAASAPMRLYSFFTAWSVKGDKVFRIYEKENMTVKVGLLDPSVITEDVFTNVHSAVLMSGTLHPGEMYADLLGIKDPMIRSYRSPFPEENRKVISVDHLTTSYGERGIPMYQAYANGIAEIANNTPGNVAVFFPSYSLMNSVAERLDMVHLEKEMILEDRRFTKADREDIVRRLHITGSNLLLGVQGGSLSEGVDYKNNILCSVIIAGIPFPPPTPETKALEEYYTSKFDQTKGYEYARVFPAINRVVQAAGRCIRSRNDKGLIVLMDKRFNNPHYKKMMPDDFRFHVAKDLKEECDKFFL